MARLGRRERHEKRLRLAAGAAEKTARKAEEKIQARAWSKTAKSALNFGYDRPVNRQAAKDISFNEPDPDSN
jgi:hypothetical protein